MPATPAWLASTEALLNRYVAASGKAAALAARLEGKSLQVEIHGLAPLRAAVCDGRLALLAGEDSPADSVISGSASAFLQMFRTSPRLPASGGRATLQVRGDAEAANLYRELLAAARPDWEEELSRFIGDLPARRALQFVRRTAAYARRAGRIAGENIAEYLQEESRDLVNASELDEFLRGVDALRETTDRIEARLARLEQRLKNR